MLLFYQSPLFRGGGFSFTSAPAIVQNVEIPAWYRDSIFTLPETVNDIEEFLNLPEQILLTAAMRYGDNAFIAGQSLLNSNPELFPPALERVALSGADVSIQGDKNIFVISPEYRAIDFAVQERIAATQLLKQNIGGIPYKPIAFIEDIESKGGGLFAFENPGQWLKDTGITFATAVAAGMAIVSGGAALIQESTFSIKALASGYKTVTGLEKGLDAGSVPPSQPIINLDVPILPVIPIEEQYTDYIASDRLLNLPGQYIPEAPKSNPLIPIGILLGLILLS